MRDNKWKSNKIVKKIYKLRKDYEFRHLFGGCSIMADKPEYLMKCDCCGTLTTFCESLYSKNKKGDNLSICSNCGELWRLIP